VIVGMRERPQISVHARHLLRAGIIVSGVTALRLRKEECGVIMHDDVSAFAKNACNAL